MKFEIKSSTTAPQKPVEIFPEGVKVTSREGDGRLYLEVSSTTPGFAKNILCHVNSDGSVQLYPVDMWVKKVLPVSDKGYVKTVFNGKELV